MKPKNLPKDGFDTYKDLTDEEMEEKRKRIGEILAKMIVYHFNSLNVNDRIS